MKRLIAIAALATVLILGIQHAQAHVFLLRTDPPADSVLSAPPATIQLWFSDAVDPTLSQITIRKADGSSLTTAKLQFDPSQPMLVTVVPGFMPDDIYTILWQVVSLADGHPSAGSFSLTIGNHPGVGISSASPTTQELPPLSDVILRWFGYIATALIIGGAGFWLLVYLPVLPADSKIAVQSRLLVSAWIVLGLTILFSFLLQLVGSITLSALLSSRFGLVWLLRVVAWVGLGGVITIAIRQPHYRALWGMTLIVGGALLFTGTLSSHSLDAANPGPAIAADWLHQFAAMLWVGGLVHFGLLLGAIRRLNASSRTQLRPLLIAAFSNLSRTAVMILIVTGLYAAYLQIGSWDALTSTLYGQTLLLKLGLTLPVLALAGVNLILTQRRLRHAAEVQSTPLSDRWGRYLRLLVGAEVALTVSVLLVVSALTITLPSRQEAAASQSATGAGSQQHAQYTDMQMIPQLHVILDITPPYANTTDKFTVSLYDFATGDPIPDAQSVRLEFTTPISSAQSALELTPVGSGNYAATDNILTAPGQWAIRAVMTLNGEEKHADFSLNAISPPAVPVDPLAMPEQKPVLLGLGLLAITIAGAAYASARRYAGAKLLSILLLIVGFIFVVSGFKI